MSSQTIQECDAKIADANSKYFQSYRRNSEQAIVSGSLMLKIVHQCNNVAKGVEERNPDKTGEMHFQVKKPEQPAD